jgi:hypothetical protein
MIAKRTTSSVERVAKMRALNNQAPARKPRDLDMKLVSRKMSLETRICTVMKSLMREMRLLLA